MAALLLGLFFQTPFHFRLHAQPAPGAPAGQASAATVAAAKALLAMLDESTRAKAEFAFDDAIQRKRWSNLPTGIFQRVGLRLGDLTPAQRSAAMALLAVALSPSGYQTRDTLQRELSVDFRVKRRSKGP